MATLQNLVVNLLGNTKPFSKATKDAGKDMTVLETRVTRGVKTIVSKFAGLAGLAGMGYLTQQAFESISAQADLASAIGTTTEQLTGLHHAANLSGVSTEGLNSALIRMTRRLAFAKDGGGAAASTVRKLGLDVEKLMNMDPARAFVEISEVIGNLPTQGEKAAATMQLFGDAGSKLLPLIDKGKAGIGELMAEVDRLGTSFSSVDASKIAAANDAMYRLREAARGVAQTFAIELAPSIEFLANAASRAMSVVRSGLRWLQEWGRFIAAAVVAAAGYIAVLKGIAAAKAMIAKAQALVLALKGPAGWAMLAAGAAAYALALNGITHAMGEMESSTAAATEKAKEAQSAWEGVEDIRRSAVKMSVDASFFDQFKTGAEKLQETLQKIEDFRDASGKPLSPEMRQLFSDRAGEQATGVFSALRAVGDEIELLEGLASKTDHVIRDLLDKGVPPELARDLREMMDLRDQLKKEQEERDESQKRREQERQSLEQEAKRIADAVKSPQEKFQEEQKKIADLWKRGLLDDDTAQKAIAAARKRLDGTDTEGSQSLADAGPNTALEVRSREGLSAFTKLFRPDGDAKSVEQQQLSKLEEMRQEQQKGNQLLAKRQRPIQLGGA